MTNDQLYSLEMDLSNWLPLSKVHEHFPHFHYSTLKHLFAQRDKKVGLARCYKRVGRTGFVNVALFGLWLAGQLPEQNHEPPF